MDKKYLLETAQQLKQVSVESSEEYYEKTEQLVSQMNALMTKRPDIESLVGLDNMDMMKDNHANHVRFIASVLKNHNPDVLVDTILWVFRAYRSHGFTSNYWAAQMNTWINVLKDELTPGSFNEVLPLYEWMQVSIPTFADVSDGDLSAHNTAH